MTDPAADSPEQDRALQQFLASRHAPCPTCGFDLHALTASACPECGAEIELEIRRRDFPGRRATLVMVSAIVLLLQSAAAVIGGVWWAVSMWSQMAGQFVWYFTQQGVHLIVALGTAIVVGIGLYRVGRARSGIPADDARARLLVIMLWVSIVQSTLVVVSWAISILAW